MNTNPEAETVDPPREEPMKICACGLPLEGHPAPAAIQDELETLRVRNELAKESLNDALKYNETAQKRIAKLEAERKKLVEFVKSCTTDRTDTGHISCLSEEAEQLLKSIGEA